MLSERLAEAERGLKADTLSLRGDLSKQAASHKEEVADVKEAHAQAERAAAAGLSKVSDELRVLAEESMLCRAEDETKVVRALDGLRIELTASIGALKAQFGEAIVPLGEPGALSTLREALRRVDALGAEVAQLCDYMSSLQIKDVTSQARPEPCSSWHLSRAID